MIAIQYQVDTGVLEGYEYWLDHQDKIVDQINRELVAQYRNRVRSYLGGYPRPAVYPIQWTSDRQRKFVMAKLRRDGNIPYRRTGRLAASWDMSAEQSGGENGIAIYNSAAYAPFVYGTLAYHRTRAMRPQQRFHRNTGWLLARDNVREMLKLLRNDFERRYYASLEPIGKLSSPRNVLIPKGGGA